MSNGWYQLEHNKPKRTPPCLAGRQEPPRRPAYVPVSIPEPAPCPTPEPQPEPAPPALCIEPAPPAPEPQPTPQPQPPAWKPTAETLPDPYGDQSAVIHSQTVGERGPVLLQDRVLHETLEDFVTSKPRERAVHVKGWGAFGRFECLQPMGEFTTLPFLQSAGQVTSTVSRFSLAVSNRGTPDASRNVRGFSTKFYTDDGVFDLLCNHLPVFAVRDAIRFPETIRALLPSPVSGLIDPSRFWDFVARAPEATHFVTWLYSDIGTLKSLRHLRAYGVNTYVWRNAQGARRYVKYHWIPQSGVQFITAQESAALAGDPDIAGRDLYDAIRRGEGPEYELRVQLMDPADAAALPYDPLDDTKVWDESCWPLVPVGRLRLERNPERYWDEVEKLAFSPSNLLPGAELSDDRMLQGRSFVYSDAQRFRLGPGFRRVPVNRQGNWTPDRQVSSGLGVETCGVQVRADLPKQDDFAQAGERYRAFSPEERDRLAENIAAELAGTPEETRRAVLGYLYCADEDYGRSVAQKMEEK